MADNPTTADDLPVLREAIAASLGGAYWTVNGGGWPEPDPALPDGYRDLVAAPVLVGAAPLGAEVDLPRLLSVPPVEPAPERTTPAHQGPAFGPQGGPAFGPQSPAPAAAGRDAEPSLHGSRPGRHRRVARVA